MAYKTNDTIIGDIEQRGIITPCSIEGTFVGQRYVQTTDATATTILTLPITTSPSTGLRFHVNISAIKQDGSSAAYTGGFATATVFYNGTSMVPVNLVAIGFTTTASFGISAAFSMDGNSLVLKVTGLAATVINWVASFEYFTIKV